MKDKQGPSRRKKMREEFSILTHLEEQFFFHPTNQLDDEKRVYQLVVDEKNEPKQKKKWLNI
jgi:hypothetical protein